MCVLLRILYRAGLMKLLNIRYEHFLGEANVYVCICGYYCKYCNDLCYKALMNSMFVMF